MIVVQLILGIAGIVAFVWNLIGIPVGLVWGVIYLVNSDKNKKINKKKWIIVTFGGMVVLVGVFALYALVFVVGAITGVQVMPTLTPGKI